MVSVEAITTSLHSCLVLGRVIVVSLTKSFFKLLKYSLDQITWTKSGYEASASAYVLHPLTTQGASISGSAG